MPKNNRVDILRINLTGYQIIIMIIIIITIIIIMIIITIIIIIIMPQISAKRYDCMFITQPSFMITICLLVLISVLLFVFVSIIKRVCTLCFLKIIVRLIEDPKKN